MRCRDRGRALSPPPGSSSRRANRSGAGLVGLVPRVARIDEADRGHEHGARGCRAAGAATGVAEAGVACRRRGRLSRGRRGRGGGRWTVRRAGAPRHDQPTRYGDADGGDAADDRDRQLLRASRRHRRGFRRHRLARARRGRLDPPGPDRRLGRIGRDVDWRLAARFVIAAVADHGRFGRGRRCAPFGRRAGSPRRTRARSGSARPAASRAPS